MDYKLIRKALSVSYFLMRRRKREIKLTAFLIRLIANMSPQKAHKRP